MQEKNESPEGPECAAANRFRLSKPTDNWDAIVAFYRDGLGLRKVAAFEDHAGYDGMILGLPGLSVQIEIVRHKDGLPAPAPTRDNLIVLYFTDPDDIQKLSARLNAYGYAPVKPENPYWNDRAVCFEDPDGWGLVLCRDGV